MLYNIFYCVECICVQMYGIYQKPKTLIVWVGETWLPFSFLRRVLLVDRQTGKNYASALVLCKFIYENIKLTF